MTVTTKKWLNELGYEALQELFEKIEKNFGGPCISHTNAYYVNYCGSGVKF